MRETKIEWTGSTWNPIRGCSRVSEGCRNCYAEAVARRFSFPAMRGCITEWGDAQGYRNEGPYHGLIAKGGQWNGQIKFVPEKLTEPLRWRKPSRIFVNSMSDLFHENVPDDVIDKIFAVMALADRHTFQVLTKRPERMRDYFAKPVMRAEMIGIEAEAIGGIDRHTEDLKQRWPLPLPNVWLGVSVEDQSTANERIPLLLQTPAAVRWISAEPLLGPVDLMYSAFDGAWPVKAMGKLDWVVVGGESGRHARPMSPDWVRSLRDQCAEAGVAFFMKQWGEFHPAIWSDGGDIVVGPTDGYKTQMVDGIEMVRCGKKAAGRHLDGVLHDGYPGGAA